MKYKFSVCISIFIALALMACSLVNLIQSDENGKPATSPQIVAAPTNAEPPTVPSPPTEIPTATSQPVFTPTIPVIQGTDPLILNEFPLDKKYFGFTRIISAAGKLWITTITGHLLVYDTNGQMLKEIQLSDMTEKYFKGFLTHDDKYLWVMLSTGSDSKSALARYLLFRVRIEDYEVLPVELPQKVKDSVGRSVWPFWLGFAAKPGELWVGGIDHILIYNAEDPKIVRDLQDGWTVQILKWDGKHMWAGAPYCAPQAFLMVVDPDYIGKPCSRPRVPVDIDWIFDFGESIWVGNVSNLVKFNAEAVIASTEEEPAWPELELPLREEHNLLVNPTYDGKYIWDLNLGWGEMYAYDPEADMQDASYFKFLQPDEEGAVFDIAFDGRFIWGLKMGENKGYTLAQVGLPWVK